jgi:hypothetical protein
LRCIAHAGSSLRVAVSDWHKQRERWLTQFSHV